MLFFITLDIFIRFKRSKCARKGFLTNTTIVRECEPIEAIGVKHFPMHWLERTEGVVVPVGWAGDY